MGTPRRRRHSQTTRITRETVDAYNAGEAMGLHRLLRLPPWQTSPVDAVGDCPWPAGTGGYLTWQDSVELRHELQSWPA